MIVRRKTSPALYWLSVAFNFLFTAVALWIAWPSTP